MGTLLILFLAWIATAILATAVASDKNHNGTVWGFAGLLLGPAALIATVGLADRRQHQLLRKIADALSGELSKDGNNTEITTSQESPKQQETIEGPIDGADDYNTCLEIYRRRVGGLKKKPIYANSKITNERIILMNKDDENLAVFQKDRSGRWTMPFWLN